MEDPGTWGPAEKAIDEAIEEWAATSSLPSAIADKLRERGMLKDDSVAPSNKAEDYQHLKPGMRFCADCGDWVPAASMHPHA